VGLVDFTAAIERIVAGLEKRNRLLNAREREIVAYHEMGHALVALSMPGADTVHKVSIIPRGIGSLGYTIQRPTEDRFLMTRDELEQKIAVLLGGRAAEKLVFGHLSTGAADDLAKVTDIARSMVTRYGMNEQLGHITYEEEKGGMLLPGTGYTQREYSPETAREIDTAVKAIVAVVFERTYTLLERNREVLTRCARALLERETLDQAELGALTADLTVQA
jgi:cell division protease FtsH